MILHLIANAHLDPVWLWDWREGLNEGIITSRAILDLMDEDPDLTFIRGEVALYEHIERHDPDTFERIRRYVEAGRWDVVGGTYVQPDTNLPATETFARHFCLAQNYILSRFGRRARVAWAADSFGHSAGLPSILAAAGMQGYAFTRPSHDTVPISRAAFWWEGPDGSRVLAYRPLWAAYCTERDSGGRMLDRALATADKAGLENMGVFYGLGNHGGGPSRRMLHDIRTWMGAHPDVRVIHSGLHKLFDALRAEGARHGDDYFPVHRGELNFTLRGCYSSVARLKYAYRRLEAGVARAERISTVTEVLAGRPTPPNPDLTDAWKAVLLNSFHDILPGSSIERANDEQLDWIGGAAHAARRAEQGALNALAATIDTRVPAVPDDHPTAVPFLVFNPHPHAYRGAVELEGSLDYRPIAAYTDRADALPLEVRGPNRRRLPFQVIEHECADTFPQLAWRKRVLVPVTLPAMGWSVFSVGWVKGATPPPHAPGTPATARGSCTISNGIYRVTARKGAKGVRVFRAGRAVFGKSELSAMTVSDPWGAWGSEADVPESRSLSDVLFAWRVRDVQVKESGPERATLWVLLEGGASHMALTFSLLRGRDAVDVQARVQWNERLARLKLALPIGARSVECDVPGGTARRGEVGEMPGGRWVRAEGRPAFGFASDALYNFDLHRGALRATVLRSAHYARTSSSGNNPAAPAPWRAVMDQGEHRFRFVLTPGGPALTRIAYELEQSPVAMPIPAHDGPQPRSRSLVELAPTALRLLALKPAESGKAWVVRIQETKGRGVDARLRWLGQTLKLGRVAARQIATFGLRPVAGAWRITRLDIVEKGPAPRT